MCAFFGDVKLCYVVYTSTTSPRMNSSNGGDVCSGGWIQLIVLHADAVWLCAIDAHPAHLHPECICQRAQGCVESSLWLAGSALINLARTDLEVQEDRGLFEDMLGCVSWLFACETLYHSKNSKTFKEW